MAQYRTKPQLVEANKWTGHGSHPDDGLGTPMLDVNGEPMLDENGNQVLREVGKIVAPYTVPTDEDDEPVDYQCTTCGTGMSGHGVLQVGPNAGKIVCPNIWIVETKLSVFELIRPRVFNNRFTAV